MSQHAPICAITCQHGPTRARPAAPLEVKVRGEDDRSPIASPPIPASHGPHEWMPTCPNTCHYVKTLHLISCAKKDSLCGRVMMASCSNLCQPSIHSTHHVLETFRPFLVKVTGAQSDFGLVQLQVDRKLPLNWICLGVRRNRLCHIAGPVQLIQPSLLCGQLMRHVKWH